MIDPAILRPGRLDVKIRVRRPDAESAREILGLYLGDSIPVREDREQLLDLATSEIYAEGPDSAFVRIEYTDGHAETLHFRDRSEEHTSELQSRGHLVCRLLLEKKKH